jgi:hypothetical protein
MKLTNFYEEARKKGNQEFLTESRWLTAKSIYKEDRKAGKLFSSMDDAGVLQSSSATVKIYS